MKNNKNEEKNIQFARSYKNALYRDLHKVISEVSGNRSKRIPDRLSSALIMYAKQGDLAGMRLALAVGANPNGVRAYRPLFRAAAFGQLSAVKLLLRAKANPSLIYDGWTPLMCASDAGQNKVVKTLLARGADPTFKNSEGQTAFSVAMQDSGCAELIQAVLTKRSRMPRSSKFENKRYKPG